MQGAELAEEQAKRQVEIHLFTNSLSRRRLYLFTVVFTRVESYVFTAKILFVRLPVSKRPRIHSRLITVSHLSNHANHCFLSSHFFNTTRVHLSAAAVRGALTPALPSRWSARVSSSWQ